MVLKFKLKRIEIQMVSENISNGLEHKDSRYSPYRIELLGNSDVREPSEMNCIRS